MTSAKIRSAFAKRNPNKKIRGSEIRMPIHTFATLLFLDAPFHTNKSRHTSMIFVKRGKSLPVKRFIFERKNRCRFGFRNVISAEKRKSRVTTNQGAQ